MAEKTPPDNKNIFQKVLELSESLIDNQINKAKSSLSKKGDDEEYDESNFSFGKAVTRDRGYYLGSQGFQEKPGGLSYEYQRGMATKSSIISAIVRTRQNRVAAHAEYVPEGNKAGFKIRLKDEKKKIEEIRAKLFPEQEGREQAELDQMSGKAPKPGAGAAGPMGQETSPQPPKTGSGGKPFGKAKPPMAPKEAPVDDDQGAEDEDGDTFGDIDHLVDTADQEIQDEGPTDEEINHAVHDELDKQTRAKRQEIAEFLINCGEKEDRPFESKKWSFDAFLRAIIWDSLVYDQIAMELVPKEAEELKGRLNLHHFQPVDGSTIRYASPELSKYRSSDMNLTSDILYPEDELKALEERDALVLDDERLTKNEYKYVQVIRGRIQRAFTEKELKVGMRNATTDIYTNGYSISELELLIALVTSHLQTEFYNRSYFQQGFSAKGILHVKANLNRSKLEDLRRNWNHMVKGNRNSFQTPIMAGMDEVQWIPLTQSHSEMEFTMWLNYLMRMICAIYQIDPSEIGYGLKDEGRGGGISGDNTKEKLQNSKDKGFIPLMKFLQDFINKNLVENLDPEYMFEWTGLEDESAMSRIARQKEEVQWKKTLNEVRREDGLPPIKGADNLVLNPVFFQWLSTMSEQGQKMVKEQQQSAMDAGGPPGQDSFGGENNEGDQKSWEATEAAAENNHSRTMEQKGQDHSNKMNQIKASSKGKKVAKSVKVEYFRIGG